MAQIIGNLIGIGCYLGLRKILATITEMTDTSNPGTVAKSSKKTSGLLTGCITCLSTYIFSYLFVLWMIEAENSIIPISIVAIVLLILGMTAMLFWDRLAFERYKGRLKDSYIASLVESIDGFAGLRHDFVNILHTYQGYLELENYEGLAKYHGQLFAQTSLISDQMLALRRLEDSPAMLGLLYSAMEKAKTTAW